MSLTVDLHHHAVPDFYWEASNEDGEATGGITPPGWSAAGDLAYLDEAGIDLAVLSISAPGVHFGDDAAARTLARRSNEYLADLIRDRPDRYAALAAIPLPDLDGAITELDYALTTLGLDGVALMSNAGGRYLGDSHFDELFAELQRRAATVFVHPTVSPDPIAHTLGLPDTLLDFPVETPHGRSPSSTTATPSHARPTSSTCSRTPAERSHTSLHGSPSSMTWA